MNIENLDKIKLPEHFDDNIKKIYNTRKKSPKRFVRNMAVVLAIIFAAGFAVPSYARDLPVYSQIFTLLGMEKYQDASELLSITKEDRGIKITLMEAILSNNVLSYTYIIETDRELGEDITVHSDMRWASAIKYNVTGMSGSSTVRKVDEHTYLGAAELWLSFENDEAPDEMEFTLSMKSILSFDQDGDESAPKEIKGTWDFPIAIKKLPDDIVKPSFIYQEQAIFAKINSISIDRAVTNIEVDFWNSIGLLSHSYEIDSHTLTLRDEDGNPYALVDGGGTSDGMICRNYLQTEMLEKGKKYTLEMDIVKNGVLGYNGAGELEKVEGYDSEEFVNAPDRIRAVISFEL